MVLIYSIPQSLQNRYSFACVAFAGDKAVPHYLPVHATLPEDLPSHFVAELNDEGTCFVLAVIPQDIEVFVGRRRLRAVVGTAGHCAFWFAGPQSSNLTMKCTFYDTTQELDLVLIKNFILMTDPNPPVDPKTQFPFWVPRDLALYGVFGEGIDFQAVPCGSLFRTEDLVACIGRTKFIDSSYAMPHCTEPDAAAKKRLVESMVPSWKWVCSIGNIECDSQTNDMGAGRYTAANGCSGGPVLALKVDPYSGVYVQDNYSLIGVHVGCMAFAGQLELMQLFYALNTHNESEIDRLMQVLRSHFQGFCDDRVRTHWTWFEQALRQVPTNPGFLQDALKQLTTLLIETMSSPYTTQRFKVNYNLFFPVTHPVFQQAIFITDLLKNQSQRFETEGDLRDWAERL